MIFACHCEEVVTTDEAILKKRLPRDARNDKIDLNKADG